MDTVSPSALPETNQQHTQVSLHRRIVLRQSTNSNDADDIKNTLNNSSSSELTIVISNQKTDNTPLKVDLSSEEERLRKILLTKHQELAKAKLTSDSTKSTQPESSSEHKQKNTNNSPNKNSRHKQSKYKPVKTESKSSASKPFSRSNGQDTKTKSKHTQDHLKNFQSIKESDRRHRSRSKEKKSSIRSRSRRSSSRKKKSKKTHKEKSPSRLRSRSKSHKRKRSDESSDSPKRSRDDQRDQQASEVSVKNTDYYRNNLDMLEVARRNLSKYQAIQKNGKSPADSELAKSLKAELSASSTELMNRVKANSTSANSGGDKSVSDFIAMCKKITDDDQDTARSVSVESSLKNAYFSSKFTSSVLREKVGARDESFNSTEGRQLALAYLFTQNDQLKDQTQTKNVETVTKIYPVSSGTQHRVVERNQGDQLDETVFVRTSIAESKPLLTSSFSSTNTQLAICDAPRSRAAEPEIKINPDCGKYTGHTDAKLLKPQELEGSYTAWTKKDVLTNAAPITEGIGKKLLERMGWREGQGLGKFREGQIEPLSLEVKTNRKGLVSNEDVKKLNHLCEGKHPINALLELAKAKRWSEPRFDLIEESGPPHMKNFMFCVVINDVPYQPTAYSSNKKAAKAEAALACLRGLGFHNTLTG